MSIEEDKQNIASRLKAFIYDCAAFIKAKLSSWEKVDKIGQSAIIQFRKQREGGVRPGRFAKPGLEEILDN